MRSLPSGITNRSGANKRLELNVDLLQNLDRIDRSHHVRNKILQQQVPYKLERALEKERGQTHEMLSALEVIQKQHPSDFSAKDLYFDLPKVSRNKHIERRIKPKDKIERRLMQTKMNQVQDARHLEQVKQTLRNQMNEKKDPVSVQK